MTERQAAIERLEQAIKDVARAVGYQGLVTDWVVLTAVQSYDDDGEALTSVARLLPDGRIPHYRIMGLIDFAHAGMRNDIGVSEDPM